MKEQAQRYGAKIVDGFVSRLHRDDEGTLFEGRMGLRSGSSALGPSCYRSQQPASADG
jgi:hypothetical protein